MTIFNSYVSLPEGNQLLRPITAIYCYVYLEQSTWCGWTHKSVQNNLLEKKQMEQDVGWKPVHEPVGSDIISISSFFLLPHMASNSIDSWPFHWRVTSHVFVGSMFVGWRQQKQCFLSIINHHDCCQPNPPLSVMSTHVNLSWSN